MKLDVSKAFLRPLTPFPFEADVPLEEQEVNGDLVAFDPVHVEGTFFMADDVIRVEGELETVTHAPCAVCLKQTDTKIHVSFNETFRKDADEEEDECFSYENKDIPLGKMVFTLVTLQLPMRFKCEGECKADGELKAWNEAEKIWAEEGDEGEGTYRPFEQLGQMMEDFQEH